MIYRFIAALIVVGCTIPLQAATYYIDWTNGNDANNGTSTGTPWHRAPGMQGFAGSYTHANGDRFIFRGGITWPNAAYCWRISNSGTSGNPDYYGVDFTYFSGASWTRPIFNGGLAAFTACPSGQPQQMLSIVADNVTIDNFDVQGLLITTSNNDGSASISIANQVNVLIQNCHVHRWSHGTVAQDRKSGGVVYAAANSGDVVDHLNCHNEDGDNNSGVCAENAFRCTFCTVHDVPNGIEGGLSVDNSLIYNATTSFDSANHVNAVSLFGGAGKTQYVYNNVIHHVTAQEPLFMQLNLGGCSDTAYIYNNVIYDELPPAVTLDSTNNATSNCGNVYVYNNTFAAAVGTSPGGGLCVRVNTRTFGLGTVVFENNHCISTTTTSQPQGLCTAGFDSINCGPVNTTTISNNILMSPGTASSQGYTFSNEYAPTLSTNSTVNVGLTSPTPCTGCVGQGSDIKAVARPQGAAWDIGAYEFGGSGGGGACSPVISSVALNPTSVVGGNTSTGTVTISCAPAANTNVSLSSNNLAAATVPATVTVLANQTTANFTVTTLAVCVSTNITITATLGGSTTAALTVTVGSVPCHGANIIGVANAIGTAIIQ